MYRNKKIAVVIPCYNEEKLIEKTLDTLPSIIDYAIVINDASTDKTLKILNQLSKRLKNMRVLDNERNGGVGFSLKKGFRYALQHTNADLIGIISGDGQCDPKYIQSMLDDMIDKHYDYVKGNRFMQRHTLASMPAFRRAGNVFISLLTKFSTGYYSISDTTMSYGFLRRSILEQVDYSLVKNRYDYENSMLIALSIIDASIKDHAVPAIYGEAKSSIKLWGTMCRVLKVIWVGFWHRMYYKYLLFSFHPIILFLVGGLLLSLAGWGFAAYLLALKLLNDASPSTGTVMLAALPIILGFQLLLTALVLDVQNEAKP